MDQTITVVYENGVLCPLTPLALPEHTAVEISLRPRLSPATAQAHRHLIREALIAAGLVLPALDTSPSVFPLSEGERNALAHRIPYRPASLRDHSRGA
jgi:predicted DNA-binding antitoxin AbrB/MazE fold protein